MTKDRIPTDESAQEAEADDGLIEAAFRQEDGPRGASSAQPRLPEAIGPYKIISQIGKGGMGIVYEAQQKHPRRAVALKVVRGGRSVDEQHLRLFQREVQVLARLRHPNIAAIYEAGRTDDGEHFFAMELVRGEPLDSYVRREKLTTRERLALFHRICGAINYAHQRGVIHRDLKPSNILIDGEGNPKILDFGLAKMTDSDVAMTTVVSEVGSILGTLAYMSPEQARGNPDEIDLRSDVYSLGVILYELMTDQLPYDLGKGMVHGAIHVICEEEPCRPSRIQKALRGDVETIVLKALEKGPARRYQNTLALADDIDRYLNNQPILARRPSVVYQFWKFLSRHPAAATSVAILCVLVVTIGLLVLTIHRGHTTEISQLVAEAESFADQAQWQKMDETFEQALAIRPKNANVMLRWAIKKKDRFDSLTGSHDTTWLEDARDLCDRALRLEPDNFAGLNIRGVVLKMLDRFDEAIAAYGRVLEVQPMYYPAWVNLGTIYALKNDLQAAEKRIRKSAMLAGPGDCPWAVDTWRNLASLQLYLGEVDAAIDNIDRAVECDRDDMGSWLIYARLQLDLGMDALDLDAAWLHASYADLRAKEGEPKVKRILALAYLRVGRLDSANKYADEAIKLGDAPAINHLIIAIADARSGNVPAAKEQLKLAMGSWPENLRGEGSWVATADRGILWFDTAAELETLRAEAEELIAASSPVP